MPDKDLPTTNPSRMKNLEMNISFHRFLVHKSRKPRQLRHRNDGDPKNLPSLSSMNETALVLEEALAISELFHWRCFPEETK
jgi:hypothetical protein